MKASLIIVAAGSGTRLGANEPKALVKVGERTMIGYSLATATQIAEIGEIVIAAPPGFEAAMRAEATRASISFPVKITAGGDERQDSARIALGLTSADAEIVVVHDAARPLASASLFVRCIEAAARSGGAIAATPVADTLKRGIDGAISETVARAGLWQAQTPQAFRRALLVEAHRQAVHHNIVATDDADLVERIGARVEIVECMSANVKITTRADLEIVEAIVKAREVDNASEKKR
jgi:2-C-methyl-D-erythritol 4-phosphate cytidylyltransferase